MSTQNMEVYEKSGIANRASNSLDSYLIPTKADLGIALDRADIKSTVGPFHTRPEYETRYPEVVIQALGSLYADYNRAFAPLVEANREWDTDYQYCMTGPDGTPVNYFVQIDMVGLPHDFLEDAEMFKSADEVKEILRGRIFEIENSLAMYQLLGELFNQNEKESVFKEGFRTALQGLRDTFGKKIALLAVTDPKHEAMRTSEFGKLSGEDLTDEEVRELSGFDKFFGPEEFEQYVKQLQETGQESEYLLYVRSSDPVAKLKDPDAQVEIPLLQNPETRRFIKAYSITLNIDNPELPTGDPKRINDTKEYLPTLGMGHVVNSIEDVLTKDVVAHLERGKAYDDYSGGEYFSPEFLAYLVSLGVDPSLVASGHVELRFKPAKGTYGAYGHISGPLSQKKVRQQLKQNMRSRGAYMVQPEWEMPMVYDREYNSFVYIHRNFMSFVGGQAKFMGGFNSLMPTDSNEAERRRVHGNGATVWAPIYGANGHNHLQ